MRRQLAGIIAFVVADLLEHLAQLQRFSQENVTTDSHLMTDSSPIYRSGIGKPFASHGMTDHSKGEYALPDGTHSNG
jgi:hypothetical protein